MPRALSVPATIHGRVLVEDAADFDAAGLLVAFHGYAQGAEPFLADVLKIPGLSRWRVAAVQGLHRFYARDQRIVASWMTRQDRDDAIADNIAYVGAAVDAVLGGDDALPPRRLVYLGFSQGASMAWRAALAGRHPADGVVALAGDIPPDVKADPAALPRRGSLDALIGVGDSETWYTPDKVAADVAFLDAAGIGHQVARFAGGHEWTDEFRQVAGEWLVRSAA